MICAACTKSFVPRKGGKPQIYCSPVCHNFKRNLWSKYRISPKDFWMLVDLQDNRCALCKEQFKADKTGDGRHRYNVDHCHDTGKIRGILCVRCNTALGKFNHDPKFLIRAIEYIADPSDSGMLDVVGFDSSAPTVIADFAR